MNVDISFIRHYPTGNLTSEIIGFLGPITAEQKDYYEDKGFVAGRDKIGFAGVELSMNDLLMGQNGQRVVEVDNAGKEIKDIEAPVDAIPGYTVQLTIDTRLQTGCKNNFAG